MPSRGTGRGRGPSRRSSGARGSLPWRPVQPLHGPWGTSRTPPAAGSPRSRSCRRPARRHTLFLRGGGIQGLRERLSGLHRACLGLAQVASVRADQVTAFVVGHPLAARAAASTDVANGTFLSLMRVSAKPRRFTRTTANRIVSVRRARRAPRASTTFSPKGMRRAQAGGTAAVTCRGVAGCSRHGYTCGPQVLLDGAGVGLELLRFDLLGATHGLLDL